MVENYGYKLVIHVLYVTKEEALFRAEEREKKTGRHISKEVLAERMAGIRDLWVSYVELAKQSYLYDSNNKLYKVIATGKEANLVILNEKAYEDFIRST